MNTKLRAALLWLLPALFLCRVLGQIYVGIYAPAFLPDWEQWYSGLLPYPALLPTQILILMVMAVASYDATRRSGALFVETGGKRRTIRRLAAAYAAVMILRYLVRMALVPEARWFGQTIPIWFHLVLAAYLALLTTQPKMRSD